jgi:hypothetical protein
MRLTVPGIRPLESTRGGLGSGAGASTPPAVKGPLLPKRRLYVVTIPAITVRRSKPGSPLYYWLIASTFPSTEGNPSDARRLARRNTAANRGSRFTLTNLRRSRRFGLTKTHWCRTSSAGIAAQASVSKPAPRLATHP